MKLRIKENGKVVKETAIPNKMHFLSQLNLKANVFKNKKNTLEKESTGSNLEKKNKEYKIKRTITK